MPCSVAPGSTRASPSGRRRPCSVSASQGPATTRDQSGSASAAAPSLGDVGAGEHAHGLGEGEAAVGRAAARPRGTVHHPARAARGRPRPTARGSAPGRRCRRAAPRSRPASAVSPSSVTSMRKSSSASSAEAGRAPCAPTVAVTCGRGGRPALQVAGMRTTTPARSSSGRR